MSDGSSTEKLNTLIGSVEGTYVPIDPGLIAQMSLLSMIGFSMSATILGNLLFAWIGVLLSFTFYGHRPDSLPAWLIIIPYVALIFTLLRHHATSRTL
ncbi:hypothetical protein GMRT_23069 [Giardia muris]|uniref:Uncharacterized protein n=1 Tax=Giardia muris TaxID=5742 RepID=A0A4Z1SNT9_GIAMU|nr:hypothetical protein GMRT_23069 [Giardia muris]|eukprot:TNJ27484.1 hypothetical protein GMRT_23069 [Giardia muris]